MTSFRILQPNYAHGLWLVLALAGLVVWAMARRRRALERFAAAHLLPDLTPDASVARPRVKAGLMLASLALLSLAMTDPRWGVYYEEVRRRGLDVVFVLDVSRSMLAEDVTPNRLDRAKQYIRDALEVAQGDRVGLVTFAGDAVASCPLTVDYSALRMILDDVAPLSATRGGSSLGDAIRGAAESFTDEVKGYKAIIVLSDGEDQDTAPIEAAGKAWEERGVRTYAVGLGDSKQGGRIPINEAGAARAWLEYQGQQVWTKMVPEILEKTALAGRGAFVPAGTSRFDLGRFYEQNIATADQRDLGVEQVQRYRIQFPWLAGPALLLLLIESMIAGRKRLT